MTKRVLLLLFCVIAVSASCSKVLYAYDPVNSNVDFRNGMPGSWIKNYDLKALNGTATYNNGLLSFNTPTAAVDFGLGYDYISLRYLKNESLVNNLGLVDPNLYYNQLEELYYPLTFQPLVGHTYLLNISSDESYLTLKLLIVDMSNNYLNINWDILQSQHDYKCLVKRDWKMTEVTSFEDYFGVSIWLLVSSIVLTVGLVLLVPWIFCVEVRLLKKKEDYMEAVV